MDYQVIIVIFEEKVTASNCILNQNRFRISTERDCKVDAGKQPFLLIEMENRICFCESFGVVIDIKWAGYRE